MCIIIIYKLRLQSWILLTLFNDYTSCQSHDLIVLYLDRTLDRKNGINEKEEEQKRAVSGKVCFWVQGRISPNLSKPALHQQMDGVNCIFPFFLWRIIIIILWFCLFLGRWCCTHLLLYFKNWNHISGCIVFNHLIIWTFIHSCIDLKRSYCYFLFLNFQIFFLHAY